MRKILSRSMVALATMAMLAPAMSAQTAQKLGGRNTSAYVSQVAQPASRSNFRDVQTRSAATSSSRLLSTPMTHFVLPNRQSVSDQMRQATGGVTIYGDIIYSDAEVGGTGNARLGMYAFNESGTSWEALSSGGLGGCYAAVVVDEVYYNYYATNTILGAMFYLDKYSTETWEKLGSTVSMTNAKTPRALTTDGTNVYGCFYNGQSGDAAGYEYGKLNLADNSHTVICSLPENWNAMAWGNDNMIYAIDMLGDLYKVVPETGNMTKIGATGMVPKYITGAAIDKKSGRMFWTLSPEDEKGYLCEVNLTTGVATVLCTFQYNDEIAGIYVPFIAADKAPAAVTDLTTVFNSGSLTGKVNFKCPTTLYDGTSATGALTYKILANNIQVATGTCSYGQQVSADVTVPAANNYTIAVIVTNSEGDSPKTKTNLFIGNDTPEPTEVTIAYANGKFNVKWNAVTSTVNGGYMDLSKVTYKVTRMPDNVVVASAATGTSLEDAVATPSTYTVYYYTVVVNCDGKSSSVAESNKIALGEITAPYSETFETADALSTYTIIDANEDGKTWVYSASDKAVRATYHASNPMDDWLMTPGIKLEAGKTYCISFDARNHSASTYPEILEVKLGKGVDISGMTTTILPATTLNGKEWITFEEYYTPTETGVYNIGFHGISAKNMFYLFVDNIAVSAPMDGGAPAGATELTATPDAGGALKATVKGKAPAKTLNGQTLSAISKIEIQRNGELVKTITGINPGAEFTFEDTSIPANGTYKWTVIASNDKGAGMKTEISAFVGFSAPSPVANVTTTETSNGKVHITWEAPTTDTNGKSLAGQNITYTLIKASTASSTTPTIYAENVSGTSYDLTVLEDGQEFFQVAVFAVTSGGTSTGVGGPFIIVGFPFNLPYYESFANKALSYPLALLTVNGAAATWAVQADGALNITSVDADGGYMSCKFANLDQASMLFTGKIDLTNAANPAFSFYTYNITNGTNEDANEIDVKIREVGTEDWTVLKHGTVHELCGGDTSVWKPIKVSLQAYKGKKVQVGVQATCKYYVYVFLDKLEVKEDLAHNLGISGFSAPTVVKPNQEFAVSAEVENRGANNENSYTVEFYRNGTSTPIKTFNGVGLAPGAVATFNLSQTLTFNESDAEAKYHAVIKFDGDENQEDNTSNELTVTRKYSEKPAPTGLTANRSGNNINLSWSAPAAATQRFANGMEDFEGYESWLQNGVGQWTFIDNDQSPVGGFQNLDLPGITAGATKMAYTVFDCTADQFNQTFDAHSGTKYLAAIFRYDDGTADDWAISPILSGQAQTISFWAKSYSSSYPEKIEMLYSTTGKEIANFTSVQTVASVPATWTQYSFEVPAGTKYFAIRSCAAGAFMLMLDDFTFEAVPDNVVGYNIYRDNQKINSELVTGTSYVDQNVSGDHVYHVTAVYASGEESAPTNQATSGVVGIEAGVSVVAGNGFIAINGAEGKPVAIFSLAGMEIYKAIPLADVKIEVAPGIYMVRVDKGMLKVVVK